MPNSAKCPRKRQERFALRLSSSFLFSLRPVWGYPVDSHCGNGKLPLSVLYLHPVGVFGGASKSLTELLVRLSPQHVHAFVVAPHGQVIAAFEKAGARVFSVRGLSQWDATRAGYYRGLRWLILSRELFFLPFTYLTLRRARREIGHVDLIHANEITLLPSALLAKRMFGAPLIVHVRSLQRLAPTLWRSRIIEKLLLRHVARVVAIDATVRKTLPTSIPVTVMHNGFSPDVVNAESESYAAKGRFRIGIVGVLLRIKGVYEFIDAARLLRDRGVDAEFRIVGGNARTLRGVKRWILERLDFARDVRAELEMRVKKYGLEDRVRFVGFVSDVAAVYRSLDVVCFPSYLDAPGRPVFEAAWYGVPSIVAVRNPTTDTIVHGVTGLCIDGPDIVQLADAIELLYRDRHLLQRLGQGAAELARRNFDSNKNAKCLRELYQEVIESSRAVT